MKTVVTVALMLLSTAVLSNCGGGGAGGAGNGPAASSSKAMTAFSIMSPAATGVIDENAKSIAVTVPYGTEVTSLVATYVTTGASVKVGSTTQISGTTTNDFTDPVTYIVSAADGSSASYTATISIAPNVITGLSVVPHNPSMAAGTLKQVRAKLSWTDGSVTDVTDLATWSVSSAAVATVSNAVITSLATGTAVLTANYAAAGISGSTLLTVASTQQMGGSRQGNPLVLSKEITVLAGVAGSMGISDGIGTAARFRNPWGVTSDGDRLFVTDNGNSYLRAVSSAGAVLTFSSWPIGPFGITTDGTMLYVTDASSVWTITRLGIVTTVTGSTVTGTGDGTGTVAQFNHPSGITTDGINLYVADTWNHTIRKIVIATSLVSTLAGSAGNPGSTDGTGSNARFTFPGSMTTDGVNLYVVDQQNCTIRKVVIASGSVTTLAGSAGMCNNAVDGTGSAARFTYPVGITSDGSSLYVTDFSGLRQVSIATGEVATPVAASAWGYGSPAGIVTEGTNLYVMDDAFHVIWQIQ